MSATYKLLCTAVFFLLVSACTSFDLLNHTTPSGHYTVQRDLSYGPLTRHGIDVYTPHVKSEQQRSTATPLVIFFYGGGWNEGDKKDYEFVAAALTKKGFRVMIPDYRLHPEVQFPKFIEDGAQAVAWAIAHASDFNSNPQNVYLMGHSAGAHIAAMLALNKRYLNQYGIEPEALAGFIGLSGPYDFLPLDEESYLQNVFPLDSRDSSQPINFVTSMAPRTLLVHGTKDETVYLSNSESLAARLAENNVDVTFNRYEDTGHVKVVASFAAPLGFLADTLEDTARFIQHDR